MALTYTESDIRIALETALAEATTVRRWGHEVDNKLVVDQTFHHLHRRAEALKPEPGEDSDDYK
jgi:hypothetical protein